MTEQEQAVGMSNELYNEIVDFVTYTWGDKFIVTRETYGIFLGTDEKQFMRFITGMHELQWLADFTVVVCSPSSDDMEAMSK